MRNWRRASKSCRNVYSAKTGRMPCLFLWMWGTYVRCFLLQRPSFPGLLFMLCVLHLRRSVLRSDLLISNHLIKSACSIYAVEVYRCLGETTQGKGGSPAAIPLPLPGFLPQSPAFLLPHPPVAYTHRLHIPMMLHKTLRNEIYFMKSWERFSPSVLHKSGESCGKESARENR